MNRSYNYWGTREAVARMTLSVEANKYSSDDFIEAIPCSFNKTPVTFHEKSGSYFRKIYLTEPEYAFMIDNVTIRNIFSTGFMRNINAITRLEDSEGGLTSFVKNITDEGYMYRGSWTGRDGVTLLFFMGIKTMSHLLPSNKKFNRRF